MYKLLIGTAISAVALTKKLNDMEQAVPIQQKKQDKCDVQQCEIGQEFDIDSCQCVKQAEQKGEFYQNNASRLLEGSAEEGDEVLEPQMKHGGGHGSPSTVITSVAPTSPTTVVWATPTTVAAAPTTLSTTTVAPSASTTWATPTTISATKPISVTAPVVTAMTPTATTLPTTTISPSYTVMTPTSSVPHTHSGVPQTTVHSFPTSSYPGTVTTTTHNPSISVSPVISNSPNYSHANHLHAPGTPAHAHPTTVGPVVTATPVTVVPGLSVVNTTPTPTNEATAMASLTDVDGTIKSDVSGIKADAKIHDKVNPNVYVFSTGNHSTSTAQAQSHSDKYYAQSDLDNNRAQVFVDNKSGLVANGWTTKGKAEASIVDGIVKAVADTNHQLVNGYVDAENNYYKAMAEVVDGWAQVTFTPASVVVGTTAGTTAILNSFASYDASGMATAQTVNYGNGANIVISASAEKDMKP